MNWFSKKNGNTPTEEISFKPIEDSIKETPLIIPTPEEAPVITSEEPEITPTVSRHSGGGGVELKVIRPESYSEVGTIADNLLAGCTVVLNVEVLDRPTMMKMLDFLNGVTYCTNGEIKAVAPPTFIITPHSDIDISDM